MYRRALPLLIGGVLAAPYLARAQSWPGRPVTIVVPWAAGGGADSVTRIFAAGLEQELRVPVNIVNRTGGNGVVGHSAITTARPDGYTLGLATSEISYFRTLGMSDISPDSFDIISRVATLPSGITVKADSPWRGVRDALAAIREGRKGQFTASGAGVGGAWHIALAGLLRAAGQDVNAVRWVPSQGGAPAMQDVVAGGISFATCSPMEGKALIDGGQARCIVVMGERRLGFLPDVPTLREQDIGWTFANWFALVAPRGLPEGIHRQVQAAAERAHARADVQEGLRQRGIVPVWESPEAADRFARDYARTAAELLGALGLAKA